MFQEIRDNIEFRCLNAEDAVKNGFCDDYDVLVVNPPRKGLCAGVLEHLMGNGVYAAD